MSVYCISSIFPKMTESAVRMSIGKMNEKQVIKLTQSIVKDIDNLDIPTAGKLFLTESGVYKLIFRSIKLTNSDVKDIDIRNLNNADEITENGNLRSLIIPTTYRVKSQKREYKSTDKTLSNSLQESVHDSLQADLVLHMVYISQNNIIKCVIIFI